MNRLDSDLMGLLLAILTFALPAVSALFEKRRKEKRRKDASAHERTGGQYPEDDSPFAFPDNPSCQEGPEDAPIGQMPRQPEEDERAREIEELFEVLLGMQKKPAQEEPVLEEPVVTHKEPEVPQGQLQPSVPQEEIFEEAVPASVEAAHAADLQQQMGAESGADVPAARKSLKERLKEHPEDMVLFAEIMKPKLKEV